MNHKTGRSACACCESVLQTAVLSLGNFFLKHVLQVQNVGIAVTLLSQ